MKVVCLILVILFIVVCILAFSPAFKVMIVVSERTKSVYYLVKNKLANLTKGKIILLEDGSISIVDKKSILLKKRLPKKLSKILATEFIKKVKITNFDCFVSGGKKEDPYTTAIITGYLKTIFGVFRGVASKIGIESELNARSDFKDNNYTLALTSTLKISLIEAIVVLIKSNIKYKKLQKENSYAKVSQNG